ncbi:MAG: 2-dehydro-3-deoxygalactonokinase [Rhizobiaceae bacterium]|nr:MAG: 2-dehydro-3-deoxygalactonokinase [Rhizobiaceae bacterium]CAG0969007.1 2-dehydro-3-deoxygalactonokinase [Rhizobiaceae bacterium]
MSDIAASVEWIAVDWGTTNLRAWAMAGARVLEAAAKPLGMGALKRNEFEPALLGTIGAWLADGRTVPVVACGMVGARQGWVEAPYVQAPSLPLDARRFTEVATDDRRIAVTIVHGMSQIDPPDVMRGEETQLAGFLALEPGFSGTACLPGTHSKWATLGRDRIAGFRTFMTGELFALLRDQSILRHSVGDETEADDGAFAEAVTEGGAAPGALAAWLFSTRAQGLLGTLRPAEALGRISGLLIGMEVCAMRAAWIERPLVLIGAPALCDRYSRALTLLGARPPAVIDAERCTLAGLAAAHRFLAV